ncbi:MAG: hypothetical protein ACYTGK_14935 [Planctomycetota bacterium]|jgi:hypothetical protein
MHIMSCTNYYCAGDRCRRTTQHLRVRMESRTYLYCVKCGRRLEHRVQPEREEEEAREAS